MNTVIVKLGEIIKNAESTQIVHGRRTYAISDPECPKAKVVAYVKTQLEKMLTVPETAA